MPVLYSESTATVTPSTLGRVRLAYTAAPVTSGQPDTEFVRFVWSDDAVEWSTVRGYERVDAAPSVEVIAYDYEAPPERQRLYAAQPGRVLNGADIIGDRSTPLSIYMTLDSWWVKVLDNPSWNMRLPVLNETGELQWTRVRQGAEHWPWGEQPFQSTTSIRNTRVTLPLLMDDAQLAEFDAIYDLGATVLLQSPKEQWYGEFGLETPTRTLVAGMHSLEVTFSERARP